MLAITGGAGRLGVELRKVFPQALFPRRSELDITNRTQVFEWLRTHRPSAFLHAAAMTDVRAAENERGRCLLTNVGGTENLVEALMEKVDGLDRSPVPLWHHDDRISPPENAAIHPARVTTIIGVSG